MPVPAAHIILAVLAHIGGPMMAIPSPEEPLTEAVAPALDMTISVADNLREVSGGQRIRYQIIVKNTSAAEAPVTIRLTMSPAAVTGIQADGAAIVANAVAWKNHMPAGATLRYSVAATVDRRLDARDIEAIACLHKGSDVSPAVCASDRTPVAAAARGQKFAWLAAIVFGLLAAAGAVWLHRRLQPEPLTPANAATVYGREPMQPGGAPSG